MPSASQAQHDLMVAVVAGRSTSVPIKVAKEFLAEDKKEGIYQRPKKSKKPKKSKDKDKET